MSYELANHIFRIRYKLLVLFLTYLSLFLSHLHILQLYLHIWLELGYLRIMRCLWLQKYLLWAHVMRWPWNNFWDSFYSRAWRWEFEICGLQARDSLKIKLDIMKYIPLIFGV